MNTISRSALVLLSIFILSSAAAPGARAADASVDRMITAGDSGWAAGEWNFAILFEEKIIGRLDVAIEAAKTGYVARTHSLIDYGDARYEVNGRVVMDDSLRLVSTEVTEKENSAAGENIIVTTAVAAPGRITVEVKTGAQAPERVEMEVRNGAYAGLPALFAILKKLDLRQPKRHSFHLFSAENRRASYTSVDVTGEKKTYTSALGGFQAWSALVDNGKSKMIFLISPENEIIRFGDPEQPLTFERMAPDEKKF